MVSFSSFGVSGVFVGVSAIKIADSVKSESAIILRGLVVSPSLHCKKRKPNFGVAVINISVPHATSHGGYCSCALSGNPQMHTTKLKTKKNNFLIVFFVCGKLAPNTPLV